MGGSLDLSSPVGRMVATILAAVAQSEVELKSERHLLKNQQARAEGRATGGPIPFGWEGLSLHPTEGPLLKAGILGIIEGKSLSSIAREWNEAGSTTTFGKPWTPNATKKVLIRPRNAGLIDHKAAILEGVEAVWEPAVTVEQWKACCDILNGQRRPHAPRKHLLSNLVTCTECGRLMTSGLSVQTVKGKRYEYPVYKHTETNGCGRTIRMAMADQVVRSHLRFRLTFEDASMLAPASSQMEKAKDLRIQRAALDAGMADLEELYFSGDLTKQGYRKRLAVLKESAQAVSEALAAIEKENAFAAMLSSAVGGLSRSVDIGKKFDALGLDQRRLIVKTLFPSITISPGRGEGRVRMYLPDGTEHVLDDDNEEAVA
jgi:hypothetical protein